MKYMFDRKRTVKYYNKKVTDSFGTHRVGKEIFNRQTLFQEIIKSTSGTDIQILDTKNDKGRISGFECNSSQVVTTQGKNLCDITKSSTGVINVTTGVVSGTTYKTSNFIPVVSGTTYCIQSVGSVPSAIYDWYVVLFDTNKTYIGRQEMTKISDNVYKFTVSASGYIRFSYNDSVTSLMLAVGTIATTYEAFIPDSPSPDYPSTIYNTADEGAINVWSHKKNMLPSRNTTRTINGVTFTENSDGSITVNGTATARANYHINVDSLNGSYVIPLNAGTYKLSGCPSGGSETTYFMQMYNGISYSATDTGIGTTITYSTNVKVGAYISVLAGTTVNNLTFYPQLEPGTTETDYEAYTGEEVSITTPAGYVGGKLPNGVADTNLLGKLGEVVLNGAVGESWTLRVETFTNVMCFQLNLTGVKKFDNYNIRADKFKVAAGTTFLTVDEEAISLTTTVDNYIRLKILKSRLITQDLAGFKSWLASNPVTVQYELADPIDLSSQIDTPLINTYLGETNITTENAVKADLDVNYLEL